MLRYRQQCTFRFGDESAQHYFYFLIPECRVVTFLRGNHTRGVGNPRSWKRLLEGMNGNVLTDITSILLYTSSDRLHCSMETAADSDGVTM